MKKVQAAADELWKETDDYNAKQNSTHLRNRNNPQPVVPSTRRSPSSNDILPESVLSSREITMQRLRASKDVLINAMDSYDNFDDYISIIADILN